MTEPTTPEPDDDDVQRRQQEWDALSEEERFARVHEVLSRRPISDWWKERMTNEAINRLIDVYEDLEQRVTELEQRTDPPDAA